MKEFYGTKKLAATTMTLGEYNEYRGWDMPENENPDAPGFLIEYLDGGKANFPNHKGYISWSPKEQFENAYQPTTAMSFGHALVALKAGAKAARSSWNGKGMWIARTPGSAFEAKFAKCGHAAAKRAVEIDDPEGEIELLPHIDMRDADGFIVVGWLASQTDMLAEDWMIVE